MVQPLLHFSGNCEEAFKFYAECFDGKVLSLSRLNNDPDSPVMHSQVQLTESGGSVSGGDSNETVKISGMDILVFLPRERIEYVAEKLSVGGVLLSRYTLHPPPDDSSGSAAILDKYGYTWFLCG